MWQDTDREVRGGVEYVCGVWGQCAGMEELPPMEIEAHPTKQIQ